MKEIEIYNKVVLSLLALLYGLLTPMDVSAQNELRLADFTAAADKETVVPIYLDNASDIVGMQFNITLPYKKSDSKEKLVDERIDGHSISIRKLSDTQYTVRVEFELGDYTAFSSTVNYGIPNAPRGVPFTHRAFLSIVVSTIYPNFSYYF